MNKFRIRKGFIIQNLNHKITIFDGEKSTLYTFNETAAFIFKKLKLGWDTEKIASYLIKKYQVGQNEVQKDVSFFIKDLEKKKIIERY